MVARSLPEPLTHMTGISRPVWSSAVPLADVLPPPKFDTARFAPRRFDASTSWPSASDGTPSSGQRFATESISWDVVLTVQLLVAAVSVVRSAATRPAYPDARR